MFATYPRDWIRSAQLIIINNSSQNWFVSRPSRVGYWLVNPWLAHPAAQQGPRLQLKIGSKPIQP